MHNDYLDDETIILLNNLDDALDIDEEEYELLKEFMENNFQNTWLFNNEDKYLKEKTNLGRKNLLKAIFDNDSYFSKSEYSQFEELRLKARYSDDYDSLWPEEKNGHTPEDKKIDFFVDVDFKNLIVSIKTPIFPVQKFSLNPEKLNDLLNLFKSTVSYIDSRDYARIRINSSEDYFKFLTKVRDMEIIYDWSYETCEEKGNTLFKHYLSSILKCCKEPKEAQQSIRHQLKALSFVTQIPNSIQFNAYVIKKLFDLEEKVKFLERKCNK